MGLGLPESYTLKPNAIPAYFDAMLDAQPPERFSVKFLERLGFTSTNDRLLISILKDLGFLSRDGVPQPRYFEFLDRSRSKQVVADGIREAFSDLFAINIKANEMTTDDVRNKMRTIFAGQKTDLVIGNIAKTFKALCEYADWSQPSPAPSAAPSTPTEPPAEPRAVREPPAFSGNVDRSASSHAALSVSALQYHVNIVLPDTRDQAVYDAIFKSLREHLG
jgi:hypothetical protein